MMHSHLKYVRLLALCFNLFEPKKIYQLTQQLTILVCNRDHHGDVGKPTYVLEDEYEMLSLAVSALPFAAST